MVFQPARNAKASMIPTFLYLLFQFQRHGEYWSIPVFVIISNFYGVVPLPESHLDHIQPGSLPNVSTSSRAHAWLIPGSGPDDLPGPCCVPSRRKDTQPTVPFFLCVGMYVMQQDYAAPSRPCHRPNLSLSEILEVAAVNNVSGRSMFVALKS